MNLYSVTALTSSFLKLFTHKERCILNISSSAAVHPLKGMVHYCVGKTSREMYFKVLAQENPDLNILNYAPGRENMNMQRLITLLTDFRCSVQLIRSFFRPNRHEIITRTRLWLLEWRYTNWNAKIRRVTRKIGRIDWKTNRNVRKQVLFEWRTRDFSKPTLCHTVFQIMRKKEQKVLFHAFDIITKNRFVITMCTLWWYIYTALSHREHLIGLCLRKFLEKC